MANIYRESLSLTATTNAALNVSYTEHLTGILMGLSVAKGASAGATTTVLITGSIWGSSQQAIFKVRPKSTQLFYRPHFFKQNTSDRLASSEYTPIPLCRDRIKINMVASSSSGKKNITVHLYIDGPPGLQGSSN